MKNQKIINLRALAILIVVLGHSIILYSSDWSLYTSSRTSLFFDYLKKVINVIQMPLFFSISGFLLYYSLKHKKEFWNFFKDKFKRLIIPFIIFTIFWMVPIRLLINYPGYINKSMYEILIKNSILGIDNGHLWFLPVLFIIFIIMYFIGKLLIEKNKKWLYMFFFVILLFISILAPNITINTYINQAMCYLFWFYIGFIINYNNFINYKVNKYILIVLLAISLILSIYINQVVIKYLLTIIIILSLYLIISGKRSKLIDIISNNSFGIYLFHSPMIYITFTFLSEQSPLIVFIVNFGIFGTLALLFTMLLRKVHLKIFIGE